MKLFRPQISFEFFPPKTVEGTKNLLASATQLAGYHPQFFSVTYGAGGSTREGTLGAVKLLQSKTAIAVAPHLACMGACKTTLIELLEIYRKMGVKRIVALRGDLPSGMVETGDFQYAADFVSFIRNHLGSAIRIEVAAYPEVHPQAKNTVEDLLNLKKKQDAGANSAITQYFYNPDAYFYFLDECQRYGISIPIIPGIMPIAQYSKLARFSQACGAEIPRFLAKKLEHLADDSDSLSAYGAEFVFHLCDRLLKGGAPGLHFYTLNKAESTVDVLKQLGVEPTSATMLSLKEGKAKG